MNKGSFHIIPVNATNAGFVGDVFRSAYGEDFPVRDVYEPDVLLSSIESGNVISALALDKDGYAAGYVSIHKSAPNPHLWEAGGVVVVPSYSCTDISLQLANYCFDALLHKPPKIDGIFSEAVCSHYFSQVSAKQRGMVDCALELDLLDSKIYKDGKSNKEGTARISCLLTFLEMSDLPEPEYVPIPYRKMLERIARQLRPRDFIESEANLPTCMATTLEDRHYASVQTLRVSVPTIGSDWDAATDNVCNRAFQNKAVNLQIILNMASPHIGAAVNVLRKKGFFFGGMAPRWFGTDGLLMLKLFGSNTEYDKIKLYTETARELFAFVKADREAVYMGCCLKD